MSDLETQVYDPDATQAYGQLSSPFSTADTQAYGAWAWMGVYQELLSEWYIPVVAGVHGAGYYWQQDNAPSHNSGSSRKFLQELLASTGGELLVWPPNSPDLSPLDYSIWHTWDQLVKAELRDVKATPALLRAAIVAAHSKLPVEDVQASIRHWPKRLAACVKAHGSQSEHML